MNRQFNPPVVACGEIPLPKYITPDAAVPQAASIKSVTANISNQISDLYAITYRIEEVVAGHIPEPETCRPSEAPGSLQEEMLSYSEAIARIYDRLMRIERVLG